ncbi:MAG: MFS transporter [Candidatus Limnocylindria bacterium]
MSLERQPRDESQSELAAAAPKRKSLWRHGDFRKLWTGQTISQLGDEVTQLAIPLVAALTLEVTPFEFGLLAVLQFLPFILLTIPAGVWVDRLRRKPILIGANVGRAVLLTSIPLAFVGGWLTIWQLYVVAFAIGCLEVFFDIAYQSYLPSVVERDRLVEGNAKLELSVSATGFIGPGIAGVLAELLRPAIAILFDVASYLGSVVFLLLIRRPETPPEPHDPATGPRPSMRQEAVEGLRYVLGHRYLRSIAACTGTLNLFGNIGGAILLLYIVQELGLSAGTIGIVLSIGKLGVLVAALLAERLGRWFGVGPIIVWSAFLSSFALLPIAVAPREAPVPFLIAAGFIGTVTAVVYNINQVSLRQAITPDRMLGRMNATMRFIVWGTIPIGALVGGVLGGVIGLQATIWVGAIGSFLGFLPVLLSPVRSLKEIPSSEPA